ncbi:MAG: hypothetical protein D6795_06950 [Deltaproteobacteria bacterium]|nr:MAG: hypothetical protein D6795_06950 [Deltaproteobacteria bacterium]
MLIFVKQTGKRLWAAWMAFAHLVGRVNTAVLLTLFFFLALGPYALLLRLVGKRFSDRRFDVGGTNWVAKERKAQTLEAYRRPF